MSLNPLQAKLSLGLCRHTMAKVPIPLMRAVVSKLGSRDLANLAMSCRFFRALASNAVPGLLLSLYPHQVPPLS